MILSLQFGKLLLYVLRLKGLELDLSVGFVQLSLQGHHGVLCGGELVGHSGVFYDKVLLRCCQLRGFSHQPFH